jgi:hypothetical protein
LCFCLDFQGVAESKIDLFPFVFGFGFDLQEILIGFVLIQKMMMMMMMMMMRRRRRRSC